MNKDNASEVRFRVVLPRRGHATGMIGCNEEDAVANYLKGRMEENRT